MKKLILYERGFGAAAAICVALLAAALIIRFAYCEYCELFAMMGIVAAVALFFTTHKKLITAKAIADSAVICIHPAVIRGEAEEEITYVSCFGILLGAKIIQFNQNGVWLKNVEIGQDYISFGYGETGEELHNIRLLYSKPDEQTLKTIIENFRKETGVVPVIAG